MTHITRRECLIRMIGATAAAAVAPLLDLTDMTPGFWNQSALKQYLPWRVQFPDGTSFLFDAHVTREIFLDDGTVELSVKPIGLTHHVIAAVESDATADELAAKPVVVNAGDVLMELQKIGPPSLDRFDDENIIGGLKKTGELTFTVKMS